MKEKAMISGSRKTFCVFLALTLVVCLFLSACGTKSKLKGHWVSEDDDTYAPYDIVLDSDGTGTCDGLSVNWSYEDGTLTISTFFGVYDYECSVSGSKMTLDGYTYEKQ